MPSPFAAAAARLSAGIDAKFGEVLRIVPISYAQYKEAVPDPSRQAAEIVGVFTDGAGRSGAAPPAGAIGRSFERGNSGALILVSFDVRNMPAYAIVEHDRVVRTGAPGAPEYEVTSVDADGDSRVVLTMIEV